MHAHERTLIARMGFEDPDKKDRRHDLACQYLAENKERLLRRVLGDAVKDVARHGFEVPVSKGTGQYKVTIGFVDLVVNYNHRWVDEKRGEEWCESLGCAVEVKIGRVQVGDIIRQINLYREYESAGAWIVATVFPLAESDVTALKRSRIHHVLLGEGFEKWVAEQEAKQGKHDLSIEL